MARIPTLIIGSLAALGGAWAAAAGRRSWHAAQIARRQLATLRAAVSGLASAATPDDFLVIVLRAIAEQLDARWVLLFLREPAQDTLAVHLILRDGVVIPRERASPALAGSVPAAAVPVWAELEHTRRPIHIADVESDPRLRQREALAAQGVRSMLVVPLFVGEALVGWFSVRHTHPRAYRPDELDLAAALAQQAALAVQLSRLGEQGRDAAILAERNRMAREIHDTLAQGFTGIVMQLEATESALEMARPELARERLARARELARSSLAEARRSVWALRPQALEQQKFAAALRAAVTMLVAGTGLELKVEADEPLKPLPSELEADLLRVAQEAVTNSVKHARAHAVTVRLHDTGRRLELQVHDDGVGFAVLPRPTGGGFGLTAMRERVERHGGQLTVRSTPGQGTTVVAQVAIR